jgi:octaprenyl-diphosphate synthase
MAMTLPAEHSTLTDVESVRQLVTADIIAINELLTSEHHSKVPLINQVVDYIIHNGGKRLRPLILILMARAFGYKGKESPVLAAAIEFMHTATLLHDDVVDESQLRRGNKTANAVWSNQASVLVGDFLYSRAFQMILNLENIPAQEILRSLADATNLITEGEVLQLANRHNPDISVEDYLTILEYKTGKLFAVSAQIGSIVAGTSLSLQHAATEYGVRLGIAFQLIDDVLDYRASPEKTGKNLGDDLAEGSPTLPLIYAMQHAQPQERELIRHAIEAGDISNMDEIKRIIETSGAIAYTEDCAIEQAKLAIAALHKLPNSKFREGLASLAYFAVHRDH